MRRVKLFVAVSLDGFIAGPNGEVHWLFKDQDYGLRAFFETVDTVLLGRKTYDFMLRHVHKAYPGMRNVVFSRTPRRSDHPEVEWVSSDPAGFVAALRRQAGKDIWLCGGGELFAALLEAGQVDDLLLAVHPVVLGAGIPLFARRTRPVELRLERSEAFGTGLQILGYRVLHQAS